MKTKAGLWSLCLGVSLLSAAARAEPAAENAAAPRLNPSAWCVGGPVGPSYAYTNYAAARQCGQRVGSYSNACSRDVRVGGCSVYSWQYVNIVNPAHCACGNSGYGYVGYWY